MGRVLVVIAVLLVYALIMVLLLVLGRRVRRSGRGGDALGPFEELWHPAAHRARVEVRTHDSRQEPAPSPGDPP
ncbi:MAG: hypothetical protein WKF57_01830 [Nakamurella sp.]